MIISRYVGFESSVDRLDSNVDFSLDSPDAVVCVVVATASCGCSLMVNVTVAERVFPPPDASIVTVKLPVGVDSIVDMVNVEVKTGLPEAGLKLGDAPLGKPTAVKDTD